MCDICDVSFTQKQRSRREVAKAGLASLIFAGAGPALNLGLVFQAAASERSPRVIAGKLDIEAVRQTTGAARQLRLGADADQTAFVIGRDAFLTDAGFEAEVEIAENGSVKALNIVAGQLLSVFEPIAGRETKLQLPNASASIRGTGCFVDVSTDSPLNYICCCYGELAFQESSSGDKQHLKTSYHSARHINEKGDFMDPPYAVPLGHYDDQLVALERRVNRTPHWQLPNNEMQFFAPEAPRF